MPRLILIEMGPHLIDTARYLMGEIESVSATLGKFGRNSIGEDSATLSVEFSSGAVALIDMSWCASTDQARPEWALNETIVEGTEGSLRLLLDGSLERTTIDGRRERRAVPLPPDDQVYVDGYAATQRHFIDGLKHDRDHETSGVSTLKTMDVIWAGYISAEQRRTITILSLS